VTAAVKLPPFVIRSMTKIQPTTSEMSRMSGKPNLLRSSQAAARISNQRASRDHDQCENEPFTPFQPNHSKRKTMKAPHAITEANAKMPAAIRRSRMRKPWAIT
jgi:hypothetical protein